MYLSRSAAPSVQRRTTPLKMDAWKPLHNRSILSASGRVQMPNRLQISQPADGIVWHSIKDVAVKEASPQWSIIVDYSQMDRTFRCSESFTKKNCKCRVARTGRKIFDWSQTVLESIVGHVQGLRCYLFVLHHTNCRDLRRAGRVFISVCLVVSLSTYDSKSYG